jgi:hypothetical protein
VSAGEFASFRAFMGGLVDYAGLFPPASLDMPAAVAEYAAHCEEQEAWMLGRFIVPAGRLEELRQARASLPGKGTPWALSLLVGGRDSGEGALEAASSHGAAAAHFLESSGTSARIEVLESPIPADVSGLEIPAFLGIYVETLAAGGLGGRELYLEILPGADDLKVLEAINALSSFENRFTRIGAKLRCGGVTPEAFPTCERVAGFIDNCRRLGLPLKCTAGLHHPVRHQAAEPAVMMHGFLNVFGAGVLAHGLGAGVDILTACVAETDPAAFGFSEGGFSWRDHVVDAAALDRAREGFLPGFGSCSFNEPRDDLRNLGLL